MKDNYDIIFESIEKQVNRLGLSMSVTYRYDSDDFGTGIAFDTQNYQGKYIFPFQIEREKGKMHIQIHKKNKDILGTDTCLQEFTLDVSSEFFNHEQIIAMDEEIYALMSGKYYLI